MWRNQIRPLKTVPLECENNFSSIREAKGCEFNKQSNCFFFLNKCILNDDTNLIRE